VFSAPAEHMGARKTFEKAGAWSVRVSDEGVADGSRGGCAPKNFCNHVNMSSQKISIRLAENIAEKFRLLGKI
jgi:hypothetical protein